MEKNVDDSARERNAARGAMIAEREARRASMAVVAGVGGKLSRRVSAVLLDQEMFDGWVVEKGGVWDWEWKLPRDMVVAKAANVEGFMTWLCGQISSGVSASVLCRDYGQEMGLLGAFLSEVPERLAQYRRAKTWGAEVLVDEALSEAWDDGPDVVRSGLRVKTNMQVAGKYNRPEYGEEKQVGAPGVPVINFVMVPQGMVERVEVIEQVTVTAEPKEVASPAEQMYI